MLGTATGTRTRHPESTALGHVSWYSLSAACLSAKCAAPMRSHRPMGSGKPSLVSSVAGGCVGCWGGWLETHHRLENKVGVNLSGHVFTKGGKSCVLIQIKERLKIQCVFFDGHRRLVTWDVAKKH